jgi:hypothetical protein
LKLGDARVQKIAAYYKDQGYLTITNPANHIGPDIIVISLPDGIIRKVIEVTNYVKPQIYVNNERLKRYIDSLLYFRNIANVELELVVSYKDNLSPEQHQHLEQIGIRVKVVGEQDQPQEEVNAVGWID